VYHNASTVANETVEAVDAKEAKEVMALYVCQYIDDKYTLIINQLKLRNSHI
jgi:hypothetical protein